MISFDRKAFAKGVNDVLTLAPLRRLLFGPGSIVAVLSLFPTINLKTGEILGPLARMEHEGRRFRVRKVWRKPTE